MTVSHPGWHLHLSMFTSMTRRTLMLWVRARCSKPHFAHKELPSSDRAPCKCLFISSLHQPGKRSAVSPHRRRGFLQIEERRYFPKRHKMCKMVDYYTGIRWPLGHQCYSSITFLIWQPGTEHLLCVEHHSRYFRYTSTLWCLHVQNREQFITSLSHVRVHALSTEAPWVPCFGLMSLMETASTFSVHQAWLKWMPWPLRRFFHTGQNPTTTSWKNRPRGQAG